LATRISFKLSLNHPFLENINRTVGLEYILERINHLLAQEY